MLEDSWPTFVTTGTAVISLACTVVMMWRGKPRLRIYATIDGGQITVWVRNHGQGEGRIANLILGGTRNGDGGCDVTSLVSAVPVVPAGQLWGSQFAVADMPPAARVAVRDGWASVWLHAGRRRPARAEVMVRGGRGGRPAAWRRPPAWAKFSRLLPTVAMLLLLASAPVANSGATAAGSPRELGAVAGWSIAGLVLLSCLVAATAAHSRWDSIRQQMQRRVVYFCMVASWLVHMRGIPHEAVVAVEFAAMGAAWILLCPGVWPREKPRALAAAAAIRRWVPTSRP